MNPIRPEKLEHFTGQESCRRILSVLIGAATKRGEPISHLLLSGPAGLGKTTLARIVANEMGGRLIEVVASSIKNASDLTKHLLALKANDVFFIDEVHALPRKLEEILYPAMEDGIVTTSEKGFDDLLKQIGIKGGEHRTAHQLPPFTMIGATTLLGLVTAPLRSRFSQILELKPYSNPELERIILGAAARLGFDLPNGIAARIALRSRGSARIAINNLQWFRDFNMADGGVPTAKALNAAFRLKGIDRNGMTKTDRECLWRLCETEEPVGIDTLASLLGESTETVEQNIEPFLLRRGYITRTARGRMATEKARALFQEAI